MFAQLLSLHPVLAARDLGESIGFFRRMGFTLVFVDNADNPRYAAVQRDQIELHLQWADPTQWQKGVDRPAIRFYVADVDRLFAEYRESGVVNTISSDGSPWAQPAETPWGTREFHLRDPGGNSLQFYRER